MGSRKKKDAGLCFGMDIVLFETSDKEVTLSEQLKNDSVWLNREQLAELFGRDGVDPERLRGRYNKLSIFKAWNHVKKHDFRLFLCRDTIMIRYFDA